MGTIDRIAGRPAAEIIGAAFRREYGRVFASLVAYLGDFELAEDALQEAFATALSRWSDKGIPERPGAWLTTVARNVAVDWVRHSAMAARKSTELKHLEELERPDPRRIDDFPDDRLRLIFTCCHPSLSESAQVALTLRSLCGLTTADIARLFLVPESTVAQRLVRAKRKIRVAKIPYQVPDPDALPERLATVLEVVYLLFTEGYAATSGHRMVRRPLTDEAIRLARLLHQLMPSNPEIMGLLALMLLHDSRRDARVNARGELIALAEQDRTMWDDAAISEGTALLDRALERRLPGPYQIQAAIAALHAQARRAAQTDWSQIAQLYTRLMELQPSPVAALNRAVAIGMSSGPERGLEELDLLADEGALQNYHRLHAARGELLRRAGRAAEAVGALRKAVELTHNELEVRALQKRIAETDV
ncbi:MAG: RNA polymerase sigma factor [Proteobacteria bacterium]|nr:RNA polymerase sigma factor [Pseudomonadota bacterium]